MEQSGNLPIFNIPRILLGNIPRDFIGNIFRIFWEYIMGMFHEYSTNNIPETLFGNIPWNFIGRFFRIFWEHIMGMFHEYSTNIYLANGQNISFENTKINQPHLLTQYYLFAGNMNASIASQSKRREENSTGRSSRGFRNQNGKHLLNLCESNIIET